MQSTLMMIYYRQKVLIISY